MSSMRLNLSSKKGRRKLQVLKMALLACEEHAKPHVPFSTILTATCQLGAKLDPPIKEGEAESILVDLFVHLQF